MKEIKPYYRRKNKLFFRKGKLRMIVEMIGVGQYQFRGDVIEGKIDFNEFNASIPVEIKIYK